MRTAVFPGSFDPITKGHEDVIRRGLELFDRVVIAIGINSEKKYLFSLEQRLAFIRQTFGDETRIEVDTYHGLTVEYCRQKGIRFLLRGLRNPADFEFEKSIAQTNRKLSGIETVFLLTKPSTSYISSSIVREIYRYGGDIGGFVPNAVKDMLG